MSENRNVITGVVVVSAIIIISLLTAVFAYRLGYDVALGNAPKATDTEAYDNGYQKGFDDGMKLEDYNLRDPTYKEVMIFIESDKTDRNEYDPNNWTCLSFTQIIKNNAFEAGYRCGYVEIEFPDSAHAIVCFDTVDQGLIFIEPQNDDVMKLTVGQPYWDRAKYESPDFNDTIMRYRILW